VINTHEKLIEMILERKMSKEQLYEMLARKGYKGTAQDMIVDFLGAISDTSAMLSNSVQMNSEERAEEEYWSDLIEEMNLNY